MMTLYIVPTPIGNLLDITYRAVDVLNNVDLILAEDTRTSKKLLNKYSIKTRVESFHSYNEHSKLESIIKKLKSGNTIALISDAGTPSISDPGFLLIRESISRGINVYCLPGPTALIPALVQSGFSSDRFIFEGFLPHKKGRKSRLENLSEEKRTIIIYESPYRIIKTLNQLLVIFGNDRKISIVRELTKKFENQFRGSIKESINYYNKNLPKGEFVIVISPPAKKT
ncbi:MAG: 16S rRNA (cytidine(1402)-2'-O)-methyltransferase [Flavobacteriaceae bacterium]|nr:16S rRNA (cytidine(1402)-2'-O)-methyltransferase [Flavobacteriaceae bacterium]